jgi:hypothetical protein
VVLTTTTTLCQLVGVTQLLPLLLPLLLLLLLLLLSQSVSE